MGKLKDIYEGWKSYLVEDPVRQKIARQRARICSDCDKPVEGTFEKFMPDYSLEEIQGLKCSLCSCPLSTATRSKNYKCPLGKW